MKKEIWIDEASLKQLYAEDSVIAKLRTEIQSIPEVQLVEADLDMAAEIDRLHAINAELVEKVKKLEAAIGSENMVYMDSNFRMSK